MEKLRYRFDGQLKPTEIIEIVENHKNNVVPDIVEQNEYAKGRNTGILNRIIPSKQSPNNKLPIPYGKRIVNIISSYMFLPGLITYGSENQTYFDSLNEIFDVNDEPLETYRIGLQTSIHGVGYEMFYNEGLDPTVTVIDAQPAFDRTMPRFEKVPLTETIPIYDFDIIPNIQAFIRFYMVDAEETEYIDVYYPDVVMNFARKKNQKELIRLGGRVHGYTQPPLVVYENNEDLMGDFQAVQPLIDAYDVLLSDSMNEFDRFAWAYLIAKGFVFTDDMAEKIKHMRAFSGLNKDDSVEFLTKPVEVEFIRYMAEQIRAEIHRGSGIPDLDDYKWGSNASGETLDKFIYLMELFTGPKEAYFKRGLKKRIEMLTGYSGLPGDASEMDIVMNRNDPDKSMLLADLLEKYSGHVTEKTLLENFADFVDDVDAELEALAEEKEKRLNMYGPGLFGDNDAEEDASQDTGSLQRDRPNDQQRGTGNS